jgi:hypothetical protein
VKSEQTGLVFPASNDPGQSSVWREVTQGRVPRFASGAPYGQGMRLANMATRPSHHEVVDSDDEAFGSETAQDYDEEATKARWYHTAEAGIKWALSAGHNESGTAERRSRPVYSKLETRSSDELDWRDPNVTIVSSTFNTGYLYNVACPPSSPLHAGALSARNIVLPHLQFLCFFIILLLKNTLSIFSSSIVFVAAQLYTHSHLLYLEPLSTRLLQVN